MKRPASQYYWGDWWKDKALHSCSLAARGIWHEMNCLMHEGEPYGHLTLNGKPMTVAQLANQCRISTQLCAKLLRELEDAGVPSKTDEGVLYSRRMVRDEAAREARAEVGRVNGVKGAEFGALGAEHGKKGGRPPKENGGEEPGQKPPHNPLPSSSSASTSSPSGMENPSGSSAEPTPIPARKVKTDSDQGVIPCPYDEIIARYHEVLSELPRVRLRSPSRERAMRKMWAWVLTSKTTNDVRRAENREQALDWFRRYFERASLNDFLMGRSGRSSGHEHWQCDFDFLLTEKGKCHVIEKTGVAA